MFPCSNPENWLIQSYGEQYETRESELDQIYGKYIFKNVCPRHIRQLFIISDCC